MRARMLPFCKAENGISASLVFLLDADIQDMSLPGRLRKASEWRGFRAIGDAVQKIQGKRPDVPHSPFEDSPVNFKLTHNTRKRQFTGEIKASEVVKLFHGGKQSKLIRNTIAAFLLLDISLFIYLIF